MRNEHAYMLYTIIKPIILFVYMNYNIYIWDKYFFIPYSEKHIHGTMIYLYTANHYGNILARGVK